MKTWNPRRLSRILASAEAEQFLLPTLRGFAIHYLGHFMGPTPLRALFAYSNMNMIFMIIISWQNNSEGEFKSSWAFDCEVDYVCISLIPWNHFLRGWFSSSLPVRVYYIFKLRFTFMHFCLHSFSLCGTLFWHGATSTALSALAQHQ